MSTTFRLTIFVTCALAPFANLSAQLRPIEPFFKFDKPLQQDEATDDEDWEEEDADFPSPHSPELEDPVRIEANGKPINTGKDNGHAGPQVKDWDQDGVPDLLVSSYGGNIRFFRNLGSQSAPKYHEQDELTADGEPIRISNW